MKMLLKRNLLEIITIISCSGTFICVLLNYVTNISPITGVWFPIYSFVVFVVSVSLSFKFLQWLLHLNKPMKYDLDSIVKEYPYLSFLNKVLPQTRQRIKHECKEYDTNELSVITSVLERKLVSSWYMPYISQEIGFPFACKQILDQIIGKTFQICYKIEPKDVCVDICSILISHLKEYRKALKRHEKCPTNTVESLYKKSHPASNPENQLESADHCTNILRLILKDLVPWELRDTPHLELIVRILAKRLDSFINHTLANPAWLNDRLLTLLKVEEVTEVPEQKETELTFNFEFNEDVKDIKKEPVYEPTEELTAESTFSTLITKTTVPVMQTVINEEFEKDSGVSSVIEEVSSIVEEVPVMSTEPVDIKSSPVLRQRRGRQGRNEVKIYDRIIEGSVKTWETDLDLQCISLGQDLLASLDGEITLSRLWGQDAETEGSPNPPRSKSPQPLWFGEEDAVDVSEGDIPPTSPVRKEHSPKPAELLKDLQTTVHQAKTRIGDLQVPSVPLHVPRNCSGDEAAGMMEGLLDLGIAGLKKGLRFTGLSDDSQPQDKSPSHRGGDRGSPPEFAKMSVKPAAEPKEAIISSVIQKEENGNSSAHQLVKQQRVLSQDSVPSQPRPIPREGPPPPAPPVAPLAPLAPDSPEPEYEEAADLSTSIAKLRSLLEQRKETSPRSEEIWWSNAEETRGRTHAHPSDRPVDTATLADEYNMNIERNVSPGQTSNNMQRLDKLFQRTVTGVFNSIKTAVGAEGEARGEGPEPRELHDWAYVCTSVELSVCGAVARLVGSRRALAQVDAALDSLQQLPAPPAHRDLAPEDFEEWCASAGSGWSGISEVCAAAGLGEAHVTHRLATLLCADLAEALINVWVDELSAWLKQQVFATFEQMSEGADTSLQKTRLRPLNLEETCAVVMEKLPKALFVFGPESLSQALQLSLSSLSLSAPTRDVTLRALDVLAAHFRKAAALRSPSFDAN